MPTSTQSKGRDARPVRRKRVLIPLPKSSLPQEDHIQISLRLPQSAVIKLQRLADHRIQTKSQVVLGLLRSEPEPGAA
jgi:hypothetical protein